MLRLSRLLPCCLFLATIASRSHAFVSPTPSTAAAAAVRPSTTRLFLDDDIADMIDRELYRQQHLKDFENEWMEKNRDAVLQTLNSDDYMLSTGSMDEDDLRANFRQMQKDKRLAEKDPQAYCADRCVATGNCDVYEDIFEMSPDQVVKFCSECVLSDDDEPCEIPDAFYEVIDNIGYEKTAGEES